MASATAPQLGDVCAIRRALITWFPDFEQVIAVQHSKQFKRAYNGLIFASPEFAIGFVLAVMA
jgi:hypothetical protein